MRIEKLNKDVEIPEEWYAVSSGKAMKGDLALNVPGFEFRPVAIYNLGNPVTDFWCVIRKFKDGGAGI
jgi:hypothetical protein